MRKFITLTLFVFLFAFNNTNAETEPNDILATANPITLNGNESGDLWINPANDGQDWYQIIITQNGNLTANAVLAGGLTGQVAIYNKTGGLLIASTASTGALSATANCVAADTMYIRVSRISGSGSYTVSNSFLTPPSANDIEPNGGGTPVPAIVDIKSTFLENQVFTGQIGYSSLANGGVDANDWFYILSTNDGTVNLTADFDGPLVGYIYLYTKIGGQLSFVYSGAADTISRSFSTTALCRAADTLVVRIFRSSGCGSYRASFSVDTIPEAYDIEPNGSNIPAASIAAIQNTYIENQIFEGHLGYVDVDNSPEADSDDWYYIIVPQDGNVTLTATYDGALRGYIYLYEKDGSGSVFTYSGALDTLDRTFSTTFSCRAADTMVVRISRDAGCGGYNAWFSVDTLPEANDIEPNGSNIPAASIAAIKNTYLENQIFEGHLGYVDVDNSPEADFDDWYYIIVPQDGNVTLTATYDGPLRGYIYLYEKDGSGSVFTYSGALDTLDRTFSTTFSCRAADTMVVRISRDVGCGGYAAWFEVDTSLYSNDMEENNSIATANPVKLNDLVGGHIGYNTINGSDDNDYYAINVVSVPFDLKAKLHIADTTSGFYYLYNSAGVQQGFLAYSGPTNIDYLATITTPGTYYLRISSTTTCSSYRLGDFCGTPPPPPTITASGDTIFCLGDSVTLSSSAAYQYVWNTGDTVQSITVSTSGTYSVSVLDSNCCQSDPAFITVVVNPLPACSTITVDVSCNGGNDGIANVQAFAGTSPYTYVWSAGSNIATQSNLSIGTYTTTVTDANGCTTTCSAVINEPTPIIPACIFTNVTCNGGSDGSANVSASGGTHALDYSYLWSTGFSSAGGINNLAAGTYTVTVSDDNNCTATCSVTITEPPALTAQCSPTDTICFGDTDGVASVTASGGTPPYNYLWSNGSTMTAIDSLTGGPYTVMVTDANACTTSCVVFIYEPPNELFVNCSPFGPVCSDGTDGQVSAISPQGGIGNLTYLWSDGQTTVTAIGLPVGGPYSVTVTDEAGCTATCQASLIPQNLWSLNCSGTDATSPGGNDGTAAAFPGGSPAPFTYNWSNGDTTQTITGLVAGTYSVIVADADGCTKTCSATVNEPILGLTCTTTKTDITCNNFNDGTATVNPIGGTPPYAYLWSNGDTTVTVDSLSLGTYTVTVTDANQSTTTCVAVISEPGPFTVSCSPTNVCPNGSGGQVVAIQQPPFGGVAPYTYLWSDGQTTNPAINLPAGPNGTTAAYFVTVTDANGCTATCLALVDPTNLSGTCSSTDVTSPGGTDGTATVIASGGTPPPNYSYQWFPSGGTNASATGLSAGTYSVLITDQNGCTTTCSAVVNEPQGSCNALFQYTLGLCPTISFFDGSVASPGNIVSWVWDFGNGNSSNMQNPSPVYAANGNYVVCLTVTASDSCTSTFCDTIPITCITPPVISCSASATDVSCNGDSTGTATVNASGGNPPFTYVWSNGATTQSISGLLAGTYTVTVYGVTGANCSDTAVVNEPPAFSANAFGLRPAECNLSGQIQSFPTGGTAPFTYLWNNGGISFQTFGFGGTYIVTITDANGCTATASTSLSDPSISTVDNYIIPDSCGLGTGEISVASFGDCSSGCFPNYLWSNGATNSTISGLSAGTYSVIATEGVCTDTAQYVVEDTCTIDCSGFSASAFGLRPAECNLSGQIQSFPTGGTAPFTYLWNNGGTSFQTFGFGGTYIVTITDANGCTATASTSLSDPSISTVDNYIIPDSCGLGTGEISVASFGDCSSGCFPNYLWSNGATNSTISGLSAGTYSVIATEGVCVDTAQFVVEDTCIIDCSGFNASAIMTNQIQCDTVIQYIILASGGVAPYTYLWSNGQTNQSANLGSGVFMAIATDANGCEDTCTFSVSVPALLNVNCSSTNITSIGANDGTATVTASGGTPPYNYLWTPGGGTTQTITGLGSGIYTVMVTDANQCSKTCSVTISEPSSLLCNATSTNVSCNGGSDGTATVTLNGGIAGAGNQYQIAVIPSSFPGEIHWELIQDSNNSTIASKSCGSYGPATTDTITLIPGESYTFNAYDDWGDGWNGGSFIITEIQSGTVVASGTPTNGFSGDQTTNCIGFDLEQSESFITAYPSTVLWSTNETTSSISGLTAGTYTVTVTIAGASPCMDTVIVSEPDSAISLICQVDLDASSVFANDGQASVAASGGTPPHTYNWSSGANSATANNLGVGLYTVTVMDANGCTATCSVSIMIADNNPDLIVTGCENFKGILVLDESGSISGAGATQDVRDAAVSLASALSGSGAQLAIIEFASSSDNSDIDGAGTTYSSGYNLVDSAYVAQLTSYLNSSYNPSGSTNWNAALADANSLDTANICVFMSDGNPNIGSINTAITTANAIKAKGTHMFGLAVGGGINLSNFIAITGPDQDLAPGDSAGIDPPFVEADYTAIPFSELQACFASIAGQVCVSCQLTATMPLCSGDSSGSVSSNISGGFPPYAYVWSTGATTANISSLPAGVYTLTVTDSIQVVSTCSTVVAAPPALTCTSVGTNPTCNGVPNGSATVSGSGGTPPYTFVWSNGQTGANATGLGGNGAVQVYIVTVTDANSCTSSCIQPIDDPGPILLNLIPFNASCNGGSDGSISLSVLGGSSPYSYQWSNSATTQDINGLIPGLYTVTVFDNNQCSAQASAFIGGGTSPINVTCGVLDSISCYGAADGAVVASATGGTAPYCYAWVFTASSCNDTLANLGTGTYTVIVSDANNCTATCTVILPEPPQLVCNAIGVDVSCNGESDGLASVNVNGGSPPYAYMWSNNNSNSNATGLDVGIYTVTVTDANQCSTTCTASISQPDSLICSIDTVSNVTCFGGNDGSLTVSVSGGSGVGPFDISLITGPGSSVSNGTPTFSNLVSGIYTVVVTDRSNAASCTAACMVQISEPAALNANIVSTDFCDVDFNINQYPNGTIVDTIEAGCVDIYVIGDGNDGSTPYPDAVVIFDSDLGGTLDPDLEVGLGNILILPTNLTDANNDNLVDAPCDNQFGGTITMEFSQEVRVVSFKYIDQDDNSPSYARAYDSSNNLLSVVQVNNAGNGSVQQFIMNTDNVAKLVFELASSGAIADLILECAGSIPGQSSSVNLDLTAGGGTQPYQYLWSNGLTVEDLTNVPSGLYTVTVTDANQCTVTASQLIQCSNIPQPICSVTREISCYGSADGEITLSILGGTAPFMVLWSNGATANQLVNCASGPYSVTITDANGYVVNEYMVLTQPTQINSAATTNNPTTFCQGGSALLQSVYDPNCSYQWLKYGNPIAGATNNTYRAKENGNFRVEITNNNGCVVLSNIIKITKYGRPAADISAQGSTTICVGNAVTLSANTGPGLTYVWKYRGQVVSTSGSTFDATQKGNHRVIVTDANGCFRASNLIYVDRYPRPLVTVDPGGSVDICQGSSINLTAQPTNSPGPYTYQWYRYNNALNGQSAVDYLADNFGGYWVQIYDGNGCTNKSDRTIVNEIACTPRINNPELFIDVYPNPFRNEINLSVKGDEEKPLSVIIYNVLGEIVYDKDYANIYSLTKIDLNFVISGMYTMKVSQAKEYKYVKINKLD